MNEREKEKVVMERRPIVCKQCRGKLFYQNSGVYRCEDCGAEEMDDFGKVKLYLEENGPSPAPFISEETGVPLEVVNIFLKNGRLEIPEGSRYYIKCEKCGCALRFGRFCHGCTKELAGQLKGAMFEQMGEQPKVKKEKEKDKMFYLDSVEQRRKRG
ncbi:MAG: hypothetical protein K2J90_01825 [Lachnospiraceae bacterium]|nr:hypothetical protein [Lachnospiraceae bacterium]MDE6759399.1 hypothetical protein [Lachnospiraceae bacterium]